MEHRRRYLLVQRINGEDAVEGVVDEAIAPLEDGQVA
jgi:hypothetical protein